jgi:hypothetical protein
MAGLFAQADIFLWLQNDWRSPLDHDHRPERTHPGELAGRSVHFHWFHDPGNPDPTTPRTRPSISSIRMPF